MKTLHQMLTDEPDAWECAARGMALVERMRSETRLSIAPDLALVAMTAGGVYRALAVMWLLEAWRRR